jgi:peptidyl-prolyl cis-trans isomerase D
MRSRSLVGLVAGCALLAACEGLKEALTAHVDVVARAGSQELSVNRLGDLLGNAKISVPVNRETAAILADIWTGYQQMAYAAAHGDSLNDKKAIDVALAPMANASRLNMFMDSIAKGFKVDSGSEAAYNQAAGGLLAARHILIGFKNPTVPPTAAEKDSVRKKAESILPQVTPANFADMVKKYSTEPGAAQSKGNLGVFPKGMMLQAFYDGTAALKPGEISSKLVETQYGFHIIQRLPYADAKADFSQKYAQISANVADSLYLAQTETGANIQLKDNAPAAIKEAAKEPTKHRTDKGTLATFKGGELTVADFMSWMESVPPQQSVMQRIPGAADSALKPFLKRVALQQVLLRRADSAHVALKDEDKANMYSSISQLVGNLEMTLGVEPKMLADSAKSVPEKERLAATRVDAYLDRMMAGQAQPITIPLPLKKLLDAKYESSVNSAGIDRGLERAQKLRKVADSTRAANQPKTQIPLPGGAGAPPAGQPPQGAQPAQPQPQPAAPAKPPTPATKKP